MPDKIPKWPDSPRPYQLFDDELRVWNICTNLSELPLEISKRLRKVIKQIRSQAIQQTKREIVGKINRAKIKHHPDSEIYNETGGGRMCENCGEQAYEDGQPCSPNDINETLDDLIKEIEKA
jgi:hypothetical protein